jgi:hypothetical protein
LIGEFALKSRREIINSIGAVLVGNNIKQNKCIYRHTDNGGKSMELLITVTSVDIFVMFRSFCDNDRKESGEGEPIPAIGAEPTDFEN